MIASDAAAMRGRDAEDVRTPERLRAHYEIEKELAARLKRASREERRALYAALYDELYRRVPDHPQLTRKASAAESRRAVAAQLGFLRRFLSPGATFLEIGPGDCSLALEVAKSVKSVVAVDVSGDITRRPERPSNFRLILSDGTSIPVPPGSVDVAYSNQLMEHLHPDDAREQLENIHRALAPRGRYVCVTPNRLNGPHDISKHFDPVATGFHLKEYTASELRGALRAVGFASVAVYGQVAGRDFRCPLALVTACEALLARLPRGLGRRLASRPPCRWLLGIRMVGVKRHTTAGAARAPEDRQ